MVGTPFIAQKIAECRQMYNLGSSTNELIEILHDQGLSLTEVCSVIAGILGIDAAEAKIFVADHPIWTEVVDQTSPVIGEVMQVLARDGDVNVVSEGVVVFSEHLPTEALNGETSLLAQVG
jgi:hypothetical protein